MINIGCYVRCPVDFDDMENPRKFAIGKIKEIDTFNETAKIVFEDPFGVRNYFEDIPKTLNEVPLDMINHCSILIGAEIIYKNKDYKILDYKKTDDEYYNYIYDENTKNHLVVSEKDITASFISGNANPVDQMKNFELQNPCWYLGRQVVNRTMKVLDNAVYGFRELAGCKIYLKSFQLNTIIRCLQGKNCRFMIADEVGLGKTIEACSVLKVYLSSHRKQNVLILVPKNLIEQWRTELLFKFDLFEGFDSKDNQIIIMPVENIDNDMISIPWDFVIIDEVHNYLENNAIYNQIHTISVKAENILLLSATPIQQRKEEYLKLLKLIQPNRYDKYDNDQFKLFLDKQYEISSTVYSVLDEIDTLKNEVLKEIEDEDIHNNEDVKYEIEEIQNLLEELLDTVEDDKLEEMINDIDYGNDDLGMKDVNIAISYICDNYQIEKNIIRGRRTFLGVHSDTEDGEFSERKLEEVVYDISEDDLFYECDAHRELNSWIVSMKEELDDEKVINLVKPLLEAFYSSPWAYVAKLNQLKTENCDIPESVIKAANLWLNDEESILENLPDALCEIEKHPSRMLNIINYIDLNLYGKKAVLFTNNENTFVRYYEILKQFYGDEVTGFSKLLGKEQSEINMFKFQSDDRCNILLCDKSGGEGRNMQMADYLIHIDLPWDINVIEQRIGRLDRLGRDVEIPVTSVVIYANETYEAQLFKFWNEGLKVFTHSLSGLEIMMHEVNNKIIESIPDDFEYGLYRLIPKLIEQANEIREIVKREQLFDTIALRYRPLYFQLEKILNSYQFNDNTLFSKTMMSWATLAGFGQIDKDNKNGYVAFDENHFSVKSAQNSYLIPPNWDDYYAKKINEFKIKVQRGVEIEKEKNITKNNREIKGTFERNVAIKNDYIHFYAPGDEIFDCIVNNAVNSDRGKSSAFSAVSDINWRGFIYTFSVEPDKKVLLDNNIEPYMLGAFRHYLASDTLTIPIPFVKYKDIPQKKVMEEYEKLCNSGYFNERDNIEHLGSRSNSRSFYNKGAASNIEVFKVNHDAENWRKLIDDSYMLAKKIVKSKFNDKTDLIGAKEMMNQKISSNIAYSKYYDVNQDSKLKDTLDIIYKSLENPVIRLESISYMWLRK